MSKPEISPDIRNEREKQAVASMKNASTNMTLVLDRVRRLEGELLLAKNALINLERHVGDGSYMRGSNNEQKSVKQYIKEFVEHIEGVLLP